MLWTLLILINSTTLLFSTVIAVRRGDGTISAIVLAAVLGLATAVGKFIAWNALADGAMTRLGRRPISVQERWLAAVYVAALLWCFGAAFVGFQLGAFVIAADQLSARH